MDNKRPQGQEDKYSMRVQNKLDFQTAGRAAEH